jgi:uncharacterized phage protein (TIGR01671 family)
MNREIKFRGRDKDGDWCVGCYAKIDDKHIIYDDDFRSMVEVEAKTVGQATPWKDMNGARMFDGDQVRCYHFTDTNHEDRYLKHFIRWDDEKGLFKFVSCNSKESDLKNGTVMGWVYMKNSQEIEVVGNIHENLKILKEAELE